MSIDTEPKWTRQQWRNFIDTGDVDLSRPYPEYRLIGIEPSVKINLPQINPAPVPAVNPQAGQLVQEDREDQPEDQDGHEDQEEVQQPTPKPAVPRAKKAAPPAAGFFGALVGGFANVLAEDSSGDDSPPALPSASPVAGPSVPTAKNAPYKKAGLTNLAAATRASFRNTGRQLDPDIVHRYPDDRKKTPSKK